MALNLALAGLNWSRLMPRTGGADWCVRRWKPFMPKARRGAKWFRLSPAFPGIIAYLVMK